VLVTEGGTAAVLRSRTPLDRPTCKGRRLIVMNRVQIDESHCGAPRATGGECGSLTVLFGGRCKRSLRSIVAAKGGSYIYEG